MEAAGRPHRAVRRLVERPLLVRCLHPVNPQEPKLVPTFCAKWGQTPAFATGRWTAEGRSFPRLRTFQNFSDRSKQNLWWCRHFSGWARFLPRWVGLRKKVCTNSELQTAARSIRPPKRRCGLEPNEKSRSLTRFCRVRDPNSGILRPQ